MSRTEETGSSKRYSSYKNLAGAKPGKDFADCANYPCLQVHHDMLLNTKIGFLFVPQVSDRDPQLLSATGHERAYNPSDR